MLGSQAGLGGLNSRAFWPLGPAQIPPSTSLTTDGFTKCGVYSLFPGATGSALYSHARSSHFQQTSGNSIYYKDTLFQSGGYTLGAPTPPPGSPYSPIPVNQLEIFTKGFNSNLVIQQPEYLASPTKKYDNNKQRCDDKCCSQNLCNCQVVDGGVGVVGSSTKPKSVHTTGCSRTNPIDWNNVNVKKEPGIVAYPLGDSGNGSSAVKLEVTSPKDYCEVQRNVISSVNDNGGTAMGAATIADGVGGTTLLQCADDRTSLAGWSMGGHNSTIATPTLWQYPTSVPLEPMVPLPVSVPPVGFQLVRDPSSGGLLLLPTTGLESLQQAVVWPGYHQPSPVLLPSLPPPPLQLLGSSSSDIIASNTTLHQHTQTHSTRLVVTTDNKRKIPLPVPTTTLIKIETDATNLNYTKAFQASNTGTVFADGNMAPLVTTHVIYQHPSSIILSQTAPSETTCRSQATSPVICLTPPPETPIEAVEQSLSVQDASNQTETPVCSEDDNTNQALSDLEVKNEKIFKEPVVAVESKDEQEAVQETSPDISGLELLSNSIMEYESSGCDPVQQEELKAVEEPPAQSPVVESTENIDKNLGGLRLLCALAEQRIREENHQETDKQIPVKSVCPDKRKLKKHKKLKREKHVRDQGKSSKRRKERGEHANDSVCFCQSEIHRAYKTPESEEEVKKFIASKSQTSDDGEWPQMNEMELDMRMKLADLQRQYREKQKELNELKPKKVECPKKRVHKKSLSFEGAVTSTGDQPDEGVLSPIQENQQTAVVQQTSGKSSSKKRKVGRPKKLYSSGYHETTETIVAKKPKNNIVGYLLAAKEKLQSQRNLFPNSPPRYLDDVSDLERDNNNSGPKCVRTLEEDLIEEHNEDDDTGMKLADNEPPMEVVEVPEEPKEKKKETRSEEKKAKNARESRCTLTIQHLEVEKLRVLTAMGGLFYAGQLNAVEPPDVYSITLDGERGNRPHIMSREEILRDAIVEIAPKGVEDLSVGTRLCAYWSQQYRCLYPGSVAEPGTPNPNDDFKFVFVEFDDGDSGKIAINDIRLLPSDYPIIEYDPNPLQSLSKRKRRISSVFREERRQPPSCQDVEKPEPEEEKKSSRLDSESYKERKRLKKRKREKIRQKLLRLDKKKKKKHRCIDSYCKYKKHHKKHRKHKKHYHSSEKTEEPPVIIEAEAVKDEPQVAPMEVVSKLDQEAVPDNAVFDEVQSLKKIRDRQESCESRSKMSAFLPARQLWSWSGKGYKRPKGKGRSRKQFFKAIQRGKETITVGDSAVFLSTGRPDRPYIGTIEAMWETCGKMVVKVKWFYHPEETIGCPLTLQYPGALFESPHVDENDVQTISHKCDVVSLNEYKERLGDDPQRYATIYDNNDIYYLAGYYDPTITSLKIEPSIPFGTV